MTSDRDEPVSVPEDLAARVGAWLEGDPDPDDRAELTGLLAAGDVRALTDRFAGPLTFGTAGLRGALRAGPAGMNTAVVRRAAAGLARWLLPRATGEPVVVIGYDARHRSDRFALDTARVLAAAGVRALLLPGPTPTPVLAFCVRHLDTDAGVMVTASHNPATDNGYKVYLGGGGGTAAAASRGAQLVAPSDSEIEDAIAAVGPARSIPLADGWHTLDDTVITAYVQAAARAVDGGARDTAAPTTQAADTTDTKEATEATGTDRRRVDAPRVAYTPLHGVGAETLTAVFTAAGLPVPAIVAEQHAPDPDFPTVPFPNPEEPGALDAVLALGERIGADLVLANDPDADRCAAAVGGRVLTGDEVGLLLADQVLRSRPGPVAMSVVSSSALRELARLHGVRCVETLTGFKWIMRADPDLVFGYEEALGYAVAPDLVRDKDGITAALALARAAQREKRAGRTLLDTLDDLHRRLGVFATGQVSVRVDDLAVIDDVMRRLRASPPKRLGRWPIIALRDLLAGTGGLPPADVLIVDLVGGARVVARPSGTEPKLKVYLQVTADLRGTGPARTDAPGPQPRDANRTPDWDALAAARARARTDLDELREAAVSMLGLPR